MKFTTLFLVFFAIVALVSADEAARESRDSNSYMDQPQMYPKDVLRAINTERQRMKNAASQRQTQAGVVRERSSSCNNDRDPVKIKFRNPDKEAYDLCSKYIEGLINLNFSQMVSTILNSTTFELDNHHIKADWATGAMKRLASGRYEVGGFKFVGFDALVASIDTIGVLLDHQCPLSKQSLVVRETVLSNRNKPHRNEETRMCVWRGYIGGFVKEQFNFPGFDKVSIENGYYTMELARNAAGELKIRKVIAVDLEASVPESHWSDLYAETNIKKRCKALDDLVEPKKALLTDLLEYVSGESIIE